MELRAVHTALFAGRTASRWATSTTLNSTTSFARQISFTHRRLQEAEGAAPQSPATPTTSTTTSSSMSAYVQQRRQQQGAKGEEQPVHRNLFSSSSLPSSSSTELALQGGDKQKSVATSWARPSNVARTGRKTTEALDTLGWFGEAITAAPAPTIADFQETRERLGYPAPETVKLRLRPVLGRSVKVGDRTDFARGLLILHTKVMSNSVARDASRQRFHERPGLKRKRLKSERWRRRFKEGFKATCERVKELALQGW